MAVSLTHSFQSAVADSADTALVQPSHWNAQHQLTCATSVILGRVTASTGAVEELTRTQAKGLLAITISDVSGLQTEIEDKQPLATVLTNTTASFTTEQETKLSDIATAATKNGYGAATIDFGAFPGSNEASVSFADTNVGAAVNPFFASDDTTTDHTANDHKYAAMLVHLSAQTTPGAGGVIHARSEHKMQGTFDVRYGY